MYDLEAAADRMRKACYQGPDGVSEGPKKYTFFLLDRQTGGWGFFFWYRTKRELLQALKRDLVGFLYSPEGGEEEETTEFRRRIAGVISSTPAASQVTEAMRAPINRLLLAPWHMPYLGTYAHLLSGKGKWERDLRERFREGRDGLTKVQSQAPISRDEQVAFAEFVSAPFE